MDIDDSPPPPPPPTTTTTTTTTRRPSTAHGLDRPHRAPFGPRRPKQVPETPASQDPPLSPLTLTTPDSPTVGDDDDDLQPQSTFFTHSPYTFPDPAIKASSPPPSPKHAPSSAPTTSPTTSPPTLPTPTLAPSPSPEDWLASLLVHADAAVQAPSTPPPNPVPPVYTTQKNPVATFVAPPPLTPPPTISFEPNPIPWKGLPLEAAQWTFSSFELQEIVSKAIRLSSRDSFVRLLSLQTLEVDIVRESERLEEARATARAKWRFEVNRRTMLMQALNASTAFSAPSPGNEHPTEAGGSIAVFVGQLASAVASCDSLLSMILSIADQQSQIALIQHQHWASALGVALRKLKKAHERQAQDLQRAQDRVQTLEDELEEAWREAEKMAIEFDDLEQEIVESEQSSDIMGAEEVAEISMLVDPLINLEPKRDIDETGTLGDMTIHTDIAVVLGVTATAVASKATLVAPPNPKPVDGSDARSLDSITVPPDRKHVDDPDIQSVEPGASPPGPKLVDRSDTKSIRSVKSTRSRRSVRDGPSHLSRLSSARMRSRAASNASLRLPKALRSPPSLHTSPVDAPPIPTFPSNYTVVQSQSSFLDMDNITGERLRKARAPPPKRPEPTLALPTPPHSAGLPPTRVPSIWLETDGGKSTPLNGLDRAHSLQIFSSLAPHKMRRSNLVMSLTGSNRSSDVGGATSGSGSGSGSRSSVENPLGAVLNIEATGTRPGTGAEAALPTSNHSPVSLPTHALAHFRGPSLSSGHGCALTTSAAAPRPGSAGARLTTTRESDTRTPVPLGSPRRSLVSRASSVILRRLSQATTTIGAAATPVGASRGVVSPSKARVREASRLSGSGRMLIDKWKDRGREGGDARRNGGIVRIGEGEGVEEGEVMVIGSPHRESFDES